MATSQQFLAPKLTQQQNQVKSITFTPEMLQQIRDKLKVLSSFKL